MFVIKISSQFFLRKNCFENFSKILKKNLNSFTKIYSLANREKIRNFEFPLENLHTCIFLKWKNSLLFKDSFEISFFRILKMKIIFFLFQERFEISFLFSKYLHIGIYFFLSRNSVLKICREFLRKKSIFFLTKLG